MKFFSSLKEKLKGVPWSIVFVAYCIIGIGLFNLYSSTTAFVNPSRFYDQILYVFIGTIALIFFGIFLDLKKLEKVTPFGYAIICLLLLAVSLLGHSAKGAVRWLSIGFIHIQPSEFAKFFIIIMIAYSFNKVKGYSEFSLRSLWLQGVYVGILFFLIIIQPDLGTACIVLLIALVQLAVIRINLKSIFIVTFFSVTLSILAWQFTLHDYQKRRILTFLNPMIDPKGASYHSLQSMIAVGNGGFWGQGFTHGPQSQLNFLPERHTDFAFSVFAEEQGFIGCVLLILLYCFLIVKIFWIADKVKDSFSALTVIGVGAFFLLHFLINISMVVGIFPVVGVPLSLISYGGTHMITSLSCIGLLIAIEKKRRYLS